jgi:malonyl CoA-acyl carrier protein transacylase
MGDLWLQQPGFVEEILGHQAVVDGMGLDVDLIQELHSQHPQWQHDPLALFIVTASMQLALYTHLAANLKLQCDSVLGHSLGELLCAAVQLDLPTAAALEMAAAMGKFACRQRGLMLAVATSASELDKTLPSTVHVACINSLASTTLASRDPKAIIKLKKTLNEQGILTSVLDTAWSALHIGGVDASTQQLQSELESIFIKYHIPSQPIQWRSSVPTHNGYFDPTYLVHCMCEPVDFLATVDNVSKDSKDVIYLELAPHSILTKALTSLVHESSVCVPLILKHDQTGSLGAACGELFVRGCIDTVPAAWLEHAESIDTAAVVRRDASFLDRHLAQVADWSNLSPPTSCLQALLHRVLPIAMSHPELHDIPKYSLDGIDGAMIEMNLRFVTQAVLVNEPMTFKTRAEHVVQGYADNCFKPLASAKLVTVTACTSEQQQDAMYAEARSLAAQVVIASSAGKLWPGVVEAIATNFKEACQLQVCLGPRQCVAMLTKMKSLTRHNSSAWHQ